MVFKEVQGNHGDREKLQTVLDRKYTHSDSSYGAGMF